MKVVLLCLSGALALAQTADDRCVIEGQVLNGATGEPLKKVAVLLQNLDNKSRDQLSTAVTGSGGQFALKDIEPGRYQLSADRNGFLRQGYGSHGQDREPTTLTLGPGQRMQNIVFKLTPQAVITGRVVDEDGEPVANVAVQTLRNGYMQGKRQLMPGVAAQSNDLGEYRIHGLSPGKYYVTATVHNQLSMALTTAEETYLPVYYPGTTDIATAIPLDVSGGSEMRGIDLTLRRAQTVRVRGRIPDLPRGTAVRLIPRGSPLVFMGGGQVGQINSPEGDFEIRGVTPGSYVMVVDSHRSIHLAVEVGNAGVDGITVAIPPPANIQGQIRLDGQGEINFGALQVSLQLRDPMPVGTPGGPVKPDGSFTFENETSERYDVSVRFLPAGYYLKSARLSDQEVLESGFTTSGGTAKLDLVISSAGGQLDGVVTDGKQQPAKAATVALIPEAERQSRLALFKIAATDQNGHYSIQGIAPGSYKVYAFEDVPPGACQDPDFMKAFEKSAESVTIGEGTHESKQLQQISVDESQFQTF
jgi:protocatechuate 3,4-dioxygenase beta subunit